MIPDRFVKVFDIAEAGFVNLNFPAFGLIFVAVGCIVPFFPTILRTMGIPYLEMQSGFRKGFRFLFPAFAVLWIASSFFAIYPSYLQLKSMAEENRCSVVEGRVENFIPMPAAGHAKESFSVSGISFRYSDFEITNGFNNTSSHGGPINAGSYVRICYAPPNNVILRLEVRDDQVEPKDHSNSPFFPVPTPKVQLRAGASDAASYLIFVLFALDVLAIQFMLQPYLRTFLRIGTFGRQGAISKNLAADLATETSIKLRNAMIHQDSRDRLIWLRPRGFNLVQIPLTIARLNVSPDGKSILGYEIRLSSGFLVLLVLLLWLVYQAISTMPRPGLPPPVLFALLGFLAIVVCGANVRILRSRMKKLAEDAVSELTGS